MDISGRTVLITGAARGIGLATAQAFHAAGARVALGDLDAELAGAAAANLGDRACSFRLDVTDPVSFRAFIAESEAALGPLAVLVNNAGIMPTGLFLDEQESMTDRMLAVNLRAVITGSRLAASTFRARGGGGAVVNIASLAGVLYAPALATYCGTKHAVLGFTESLNREFERDNISALAILPGVVRTELSAGANYPSWMEPFLAVDPADVAEAVVRAVQKNKSRTAVPRALGSALKILELIPYRPRRFLERRCHLDEVFTQPDAVAREQYHKRIIS